MAIKFIDKSNISRSPSQPPLRKVDHFQMRQIILGFPEQFKIGVEAAKNAYFKPDILMGKVENVVICGMGGSALPGDILVTLKPLDIFIHKSYGLPPQAGNGSVVICVSYSGNTEETLSSFIEAANRKLPVIVISTGGELEKLSKKYTAPFIKIPPPRIPPRLALGYRFSALLKVLSRLNLIEGKMVDELLMAALRLRPEKSEANGKRLAKKIFKKVPIVYSQKEFREISRIWKISFNENAKIMAVSNYFPELNHNEIVGFWKINKMQLSADKLYVIILRDKKSNGKILKQMEITKDIIEKEGVEVEFVDIEGKNALEKIFSAVILGFWTSYWLALEYKIDPTQIKTIEEFKRKLKED